MLTPYKQNFVIPCGNKQLSCELTLPENAHAIIIFSQAGGISRNSPRSRMMAEYLQQHSIGTLLPDLLTPEEEQSSGRQYDVELMTRRLIAVTQWVLDRDLLDHYRLGYYGTSTGAAAALQAAALLPEDIGAIVCRGGRPDLAKGALSRVQAPTLLIVGSLDRYVEQMNREALDELSCDKQLEVIQGATYLFEGEKIKEVAASTTSWFARHLHSLQFAHP
ncbi:alpha/beta hydrolase [Flavitalea sp. BT771]|uniref:dienelactone hydrolase family protein n=1 Tax=Flavitalea sp. BT771 TaxID=3063329 RepID=UPI0026E31F7A|nr:alpha/beta hydrolase [Flavitalea sp. BT771]MDO6429520.1 alpha/beta hydrolase [Flavitalea sp. BT771]MDV6218352.1 alpha/beta hydrolase [Flavitalea sp. BT771]